MLLTTYFLAVFSSGQKIFALIFLVAFIALMVWAYRSDLNLNKKYYKNAWKVLIAVILIISAMVVAIRVTH